MKSRLISFLLAAIIVFSVVPVSYADGNGECFTVTEIKNLGSITLAEPVCTECNVVFSGVHSKGAEQVLTIRVMDEATGTIYAMAETDSVANGKFAFTFGLRSECFGKNLTAYIDGGDNTDQSVVKFVYNCQYSAKREALRKDIEDIERLIAECEAQSISVEYEKVNLGVIKRFEGFLDSYIEKSLADEYTYNYNAIIRLIDETDDALRGYLDGTRAEKVAPLYISSDVEQSGQSLVATVDIKGEQVRQPVFFNGYGHWSDAISDYPTLNDMGANYTHYEIGPNSILSQGTGGNKYNINSSAVARVKQVFKTAEDSNVSIVFMTAMHYFPQFIKEMYPTIDNNGSTAFPDFMPYNPTHDEVKAALEAFLRAVVPEIKDYKSFHSICLANEPFFISYEYPDFYLSDYQEFLENKYKTLDALNTAYGRKSWNKYTAFSQVTMPKVEKEATARYNDWREFNDSILTEWFTFLKDVVKDIDENIPVHTKCSAYISSGGKGNRRVFCGTNYEQWSPIMDINGCDAWALYGKNYEKVQGKTMWYDFMTSMKNAPVINSEDHILEDNPEITYIDEELDMNMADIWQGAIHGRAGSVYWLWDKSSRAQEGTYYYNSNLTRRAEHVAGIGKINLDLNRLANEITAIQNKPARCAILYSNYTQVGNDYHSAAMYEAYSTLLYNGEKVYIANDTYPEKINENENLELLIVPACEYMPEKVWQEIDEFIDNGKTVIFAEVSGNYYTENGASLDATLKNSVLGRATRTQFGGWDADNTLLTGCEDVYTAIENAISGFEHSVKAEAQNGLTEWTVAEYQGDYVVNLCNYGDEETTVSLTLDGGKICGEIFDLTENEKIRDGFTLKPYETKLVRISTESETNDFYYSDGSEALVVKNGTITSNIRAKENANAEYIHIVALYSGDDILVETVCRSGRADANGVIDSSQPITVNAGENAESYKIKAFMFDKTSVLMPYLQANMLGQQ